MASFNLAKAKKTAGEKKRKEKKTAQCLSEDGSLAGFDQVLA